MRIEEIKRSERKKDRILVKLDSGDLLRVTEGTQDLARRLGDYFGTGAEYWTRQAS